MEECTDDCSDTGGSELQVARTAMDCATHQVLKKVVFDEGYEPLLVGSTTMENIIRKCGQLGLTMEDTRWHSGITPGSVYDIIYEVPIVFERCNLDEHAADQIQRPERLKYFPSWMRAAVTMKALAARDFFSFR